MTLPEGDRAPESGVRANQAIAAFCGYAVVLLWWSALFALVLPELFRSEGPPLTRIERLWFYAGSAFVMLAPPAAVFLALVLRLESTLAFRGWLVGLVGGVNVPLVALAVWVTLDRVRDDASAEHGAIAALVLVALPGAAWWVWSRRTRRVLHR